MKRKAMKVVALLTAAMMFTACGGENAQNAVSPSEDAPESDDSTVSATDISSGQGGGTYIDYTGMSPTEMVEANRAADWKITDESVTLRVMIANTPEHPDDMNEQELFKRAEERTGIHIEW